MIPILVLLACAEPATDSAIPAATWYADAKPVIDGNCARCHSEGGVGGVDFTDPDTAVAYADQMLAFVDAGLMPPPASDPGCQEYRGSDQLTLSVEERDALAAWVEAGAALGDPATDPGVLSPVETLADPDLELRLQVPYTPTFQDAANPDNEYRCFVLDPERNEDIYVSALAPLIDERSLVHHEVLSKAIRADLPEDAFAPDGWDCIDGSGVDESGMLAAWAPGMLPIELPEGAGMLVGANEVLLLQMHYYGAATGTGLSDQSGYALRLTDEPSKRVEMVPVGIYDFDIPAGDESYTSEDSFVNSYVDLQVYGVFPHMHVLGRSFDARLEHEDGSETCLVSGDYDFSNQMTYQYNEVLTFEKGARMRFSCTWDNSAGNPNQIHSTPEDVRYGERTDEEMCYFFTLISF